MMKEVIFTRSIAGINKDKSKYRYGKGLIKSCNPDEVKRFVGSVAMLFDDYVNGKKKEARSKVLPTKKKRTPKNY